jgi:hypothetical protein
MTEASENIWMVKNNGVEIDVDVSVFGGDRAEVFDELEWVVGNIEDALEGRDGEVVRHE